MSGKGMCGIAFYRYGREGWSLSRTRGWPKAVMASTSNPDKTTKAIAGNRDLFFLFIEDFFSNDYCFYSKRSLGKPTQRNAGA